MKRLIRVLDMREEHEIHATKTRTNAKHIQCAAAVDSPCEEDPKVHSKPRRIRKKPNN